MEFGANFLGESFIFGIAGGLILLENLRSSRRDALKNNLELDGIRNQTSQDKVYLIQELSKLKFQLNQLEDKVNVESQRVKGGGV